MVAVLRKALVHELEVKTAKRDALTTVMSFVNFVHLRSFPQFYPHRWISRHIGLSLICMSLIFLRFSFPLPLPQLYNTAFYCVSKTLTTNCEPTFMTARLPVCLPACLEQDITIYRILCNRYHLLCMYSYTDYGHPMKPFFIEIPNFWAWEDKLCR